MMAYFSSGTEGIDYIDRVCSRCRNFGDDKYQGRCAVWDCHSLFQCERDSSARDGGPVGRVLDALIPRSPDGLSNLQCLMFRPIGQETEAEHAGQMTLLERFDATHGEAANA